MVNITMWPDNCTCIAEPLPFAADAGILFIDGDSTVIVYLTPQQIESIRNYLSRINIAESPRKPPTKAPPQSTEITEDMDI